MIDPYDLAANKVAARLEMLSKELCANETINTWCEIVSKTVSEQRTTHPELNDMYWAKKDCEFT